MPRLFDVYMAIDWSARSKPSPEKKSKDSIWVGEKLASIAASECEQYLRTRTACYRYLLERLRSHFTENRRILVGFDFGFGYPRGFTKSLDLKGDAAPWKLIWDYLADHIEDEENNRNNRFETASVMNQLSGEKIPGPFWGCPATKETPYLSMKMPPAGLVDPADGHVQKLAKYRLTDKATKGVQSLWKLFGNGSVGSQTLTGIPYVHKLRYHPELHEHSYIWPFEAGFSSRPIPSNGPMIIFAEIWPGLLQPSIPNEKSTIRDRAQVKAMVNWFDMLDKTGNLEPLFNAPTNLSKQEIDDIIMEEGWILGALKLGKSYLITSPGDYLNLR